MTPPFPIGAPRSRSLLLAHMLTGEREIPTQDDLFSWEFSPAPFPHFTVNGQCLSVNSSLHHSPSSGQVTSSKTPLIKQYKHTHTHTHTHTCHSNVHSVLAVEKWENFLFTYESHWRVLTYVLKSLCRFLFLKTHQYIVGSHCVSEINQKVEWYELNPLSFKTYLIWLSSRFAGLQH